MIHTFNPPFVFHTVVNNHEQIKQSLLPEIQSNLTPNLFDAATSCYTCYNKEVDVGFDLSVNMLRSIILNPFKQLMREYAFDPVISDIVLQGLWWNYYLPGGMTHKHTHREDDYSFIYLLHLTDENTTAFRPITDPVYTTEHIAEGNVMIFPSTLIHWSMPCKSERAVVVGNIKVNT